MPSSKTMAQANMLGLCALLTVLSFASLPMLPCKSIKIQVLTKPFEDPMVALPNEPQQIIIEQPAQQQPQLQQQIQYVIESPTPQAQIQYQPQEVQYQQIIVQQGRQATEQPSTEARQETYYLVKPDGQLIEQQQPQQQQQQQQQQPQPQQYQQPQPQPQQQQQYQPQPEKQQQANLGQQSESNCKQGHEQMALASLTQGAQEATIQLRGHEYPGEILYASPNGETAPKQSSEGRQEQAYSDISNVASMLTKTSGLPATILTEVPLKDLPEDVLFKLRRDYGVKVVATRERPGANLVINCDDSPSHEGSICSRQHMFENAEVAPPSHSLYAPEASSIEEQSPGEYSNEQPHLQGEPSSAEKSSSLVEGVSDEPRVGTYVTRHGETRVAGESTSNDESEVYGARNPVSNEQSADANESSRQEADSNTQIEPGQEEGSQAQPSSESQQSN